MPTFSKIGITKSVGAAKQQSCHHDNSQFSGHEYMKIYYMIYVLVFHRFIFQGLASIQQPSVKYCWHSAYSFPHVWTAICSGKITATLRFIDFITALAHRNEVTKPIPPHPIFSSLTALLKCPLYVLNITFIFDRCHHSLAVVTPVKCECDPMKMTNTFAQAKIFLMKNHSCTVL